MRQKLITLDPYAFELAQRKKNFSSWVRKQLHLEGNGESVDQLIAHIEELTEQSDAWYQKYAALRKEVGYDGVKE